MSDLSAYQQAFADYARGDHAALLAMYHSSAAEKGGQASRKRRLAVYSRLVENQFARLLAATYPATKRMLGKAQFTDLVAAFIRDHACSTPYYPQMTSEFAAYLMSHRHSLSNSPWACQLAHFEALQRSLEWQLDTTWQPADADAATCKLSPLAGTTGYNYDVCALYKQIQSLKPNEKAPAPLANHTFVLVLRNPVAEGENLDFQPVRWYKITSAQFGLAALLYEPVVAGDLARILGELKTRWHSAYGSKSWCFDSAKADFSRLVDLHSIVFVSGPAAGKALRIEDF